MRWRAGTEGWWAAAARGRCGVEVETRWSTGRNKRSSLGTTCERVLSSENTKLTRQQKLVAFSQYPTERKKTCATGLPHPFGQ
ncbi:hypothetical protein WAI453_013499 [Rhynchosporium graminicola]